MPFSSWPMASGDHYFWNCKWGDIFSKKALAHIIWVKCISNFIRIAKYMDTKRSLVKISVKFVEFITMIFFNVAALIIFPMAVLVRQLNLFSYKMTNESTSDGIISQDNLVGIFTQNIIIRYYQKCKGTWHKSLFIVWADGKTCQSKEHDLRLLLKDELRSCSTAPKWRRR